MKDKWLETFSEELELYAKHATCADIYVSALVIDESVPTAISHGYNGTPHGFLQCDELDTLMRHFSENIPQKDISSLFGGDSKVFNDEGLKIVRKLIRDYKNEDYDWIIRKQMSILAGLAPERYKDIPNDKALRLKINFVHYKYEIHAEANALGKLGMELHNGPYALMVNYSPCFECAKNIITRGIRKVYYRNEWIDPRWEESSLHFLKLSGVEMIHY